MSDDELIRRYAHTRASKMLSARMDELRDEEGLSYRKLAQRLGYNVAVTVNHMIVGHAPVPIDRAEQIAEVMGLDKREFLLAVFEQRHPEIDLQMLTGDQPGWDPKVLDRLAKANGGEPIARLNLKQADVIAQALGEKDPAKRWASDREVELLNALRRVLPKIAKRKLKLSDPEAAELIAKELDDSIPDFWGMWG